jgi:hypothetical protein
MDRQSAALRPAAGLVVMLLSIVTVAADLVALDG